MSLFSTMMNGIGIVLILLTVGVGVATCIGIGMASGKNPSSNVAPKKAGSSHATQYDLQMKKRLLVKYAIEQEIIEQEITDYDSWDVLLKQAGKALSLTLASNAENVEQIGAVEKYLDPNMQVQLKVKKLATLLRQFNLETTTQSIKYGLKSILCEEHTVIATVMPGGPKEEVDLCVNFGDGTNLLLRKTDVNTYVDLTYDTNIGKFWEELHSHLQSQRSKLTSQKTLRKKQVRKSKQSDSKKELQKELQAVIEKEESLAFRKLKLMAAIRKSE